MDNLFNRLFGSLIVKSTPVNIPRLFIKLRGDYYMVNIPEIVRNKQALEALQKLSLHTSFIYVDEIQNPITYLIYYNLLNGNVKPMNFQPMKRINNDINLFYEKFVKGREVKALKTFLEVGDKLSSEHNNYVGMFYCPEYGFVTTVRKREFKIKPGVHVVSVGDCVKHFVESVKSGKHVQVSDDYYSFPGIVSVNKFNKNLALVTIVREEVTNSTHREVTGDIFLYKQDIVEKIENVPHHVVRNYRELIEVKDTISELIPVVMLGKFFVLVSKDYTQIHTFTLPNKTEVITRGARNGIIMHFKIGRHETFIEFDKVFDNNYELL